jgi:hypothetical protein
MSEAKTTKSERALGRLLAVRQAAGELAGPGGEPSGRFFYGPPCGPEDALAVAIRDPLLTKERRGELRRRFGAISKESFGRGVRLGDFFRRLESEGFFTPAEDVACERAGRACVALGLDPEGAEVDFADPLLAQDEAMVEGSMEAGAVMQEAMLDVIQRTEARIARKRARIDAMTALFEKKYGRRPSV